MGALRLDLFLLVGRVVPLLLVTLPHGMRRRHPVVPLLGGAAAAAAAVVVNGADGMVDHKWPSNQGLRGLGEVVVLVLGLNRPPSFLSSLGVVSQLL